MEPDRTGQGGSRPAPLEGEDGQGAYATVLRMYATMQTRGAAAPGAAAAVAAGGGGPRTSAPRAEVGASSEASPTKADAAPLGAEATDGGWLRTLWAAFDHEAAGAGQLPAVGAVLAASPALARRMVKWACRRLRKPPLEDPDTVSGDQGPGRRIWGGMGGSVGRRLARFLPYALEHTTGGGPSPPPPLQQAAAAGMVRAAASVFDEEGADGDPDAHPAPWPLLAPFLRAAVRARYGGADEGSDGERRVLRAALRGLVAAWRDEDGAGEETRAGWRCVVEGLGAEGGGHGVTPVVEAVRILRALPAGCRRRALEGIRDWTPAVLDVAARAAMLDAEETAALLALLRRRWSPTPPLSLSLPLPADQADDDGSGHGSGSDDQEGAQQQHGPQSLLELTAAVYRRGGARGPGEASRLPALVALFVALQEQEGANKQEEGEKQPPRFLRANDGVAYLQAKLLAAILVEDQAAASSTAAPQQRGKQQEEGEEEEEEGLAGCGPALLRVLLTALIAPRGVWMRRERDLMEALGRVTQILARDGQPLGLLLPPPPTQAAQEEAGSPGKPLAPTSSTIPAASSRRSSRRRSAAKSDDAVAPAPAAAGATNDVPPAPVAAAPAPAAGIVLGGDAGLCRRVMAAALALCGEVQDLHRAELALHVPRRATLSPPPLSKRRRLLMPHHSAAPGPQQPGALTSAPDTEEDGGAEQPSEQEGKAQGEADPAVAAAAAAAMAARAAAEYEGDRKLAWMMGRGFDIILQVGAAGPVLPPPFLTGLFDTIDRRFGAFFEGGDHRLCRPADCPFARPQRLLTFLLGPLRQQLGVHGFLSPHEESTTATATAPSESIHAWREIWAPGLALTLAASKTATCSGSSGSSSSHQNPPSLSAAASLALTSMGAGSSSLPPPTQPLLRAPTPQGSGIGEPSFSLPAGGQGGGIGTRVAGVDGGASGGGGGGGSRHPAAAVAAWQRGSGGGGSPGRNSASHAPRHGRTARGPPGGVGGMGGGSRGPTPPPTPASRAIEAHGGLPGAMEGVLRYLGGAGSPRGAGATRATARGAGGGGGGGDGGGVEGELGRKDGST